MLKKTAAMAVLVLMITSLFSGSLGFVQADVPAKNEVAKCTPDFHMTTLLAMHAGKTVSSGTFGAVGAVAADDPLACFEAGNPATCIGFSGIPAEAGVIVTGRVSSIGPEQAYTSMIVYMNDSRIKMPMPGPGMFWSENDTFPRITHKTSWPAFEPGAISFNGKVAMFKPGSAMPDMFDLQWKNKQVVQFGERMSPAVFTAHLVIHSANGSEMMPLLPLPFSRDYILDSDVTVDLANLTDANGVSLQDSLYNNEIAAGETQWHSADISSVVESVNVDLKWSESGNPLKLTIYTPDGHILGPYEDSSDGKTDDRINLNIDNPSGVAAGEWSLKVTDTGEGGTSGYYLKTY